MNRLIRPVGYDGSTPEESEYYLFVTPSWSGSDEVYEIKYDLKAHTIRCDCFGSNRWELMGTLEGGGGCKHSREVARLIQRYMK